MGHFLREMRIPHHAPRRRINDRKMPLHEFAESALRAALHKFIQQFAVIHNSLQKAVPAGWQNRTRLAMKVPYHAKPPGAVRIGLSCFAYAPGRARLASIQAARHIFGQVRVAHHAQRSRIDEVNVPPRQFGKRGLRPAFGVLAQELLVGQLVHSWKSSRAPKTGQATSSEK